VHVGLASSLSAFNEEVTLTMCMLELSSWSTRKAGSLSHGNSVCPMACLSPCRLRLGVEAKCS
jgi:hypothetical protein